MHGESTIQVKCVWSNTGNTIQALSMDEDDTADFVADSIDEEDHHVRSGCKQSSPSMHNLHAHMTAYLLFAYYVCLTLCATFCSTIIAITKISISTTGYLCT